MEVIVVNLSPYLVEDIRRIKDVNEFHDDIVHKRVSE